MTRALAVLGLTFVALLAASPATAQPAAAPVSIDVGDDWFCNPPFEGQVCQTNLAAGDTVMWTLTKPYHTVTQCQDGTFSDISCKGGWDSGILEPGQNYQRSFNSAGTFYYRCNLHPSKMRGQLDVSTAPVPTAAPTPVPPAPTPAPIPPSPPSSGGQPPSDGGSPTSGEAPTSGGTTTSAPTGGGTTPGESPSPTAQPSGADRSPTPSPSGRTAAVTQLTPRSDLPDSETRSSAATPSNGGSGALPWLAAIAGALTLVGAGGLYVVRLRRR